MENFDVLGVKIAVTNLTHACNQIERWIQERFKTYVCIAPVATIIDCQKSEEYKQVVNHAGMSTPDGMPIVWLGRRVNRDVVKRTYGPDLLKTFLDTRQDKGYKHYFYGANNETLLCLKSKIKEEFPDTNVVGSFAPGKLKEKEIESSEVIENINKASPDILWVGLGSPKQDYWMSVHRDKLDVPVIIGVGAAFDFFAGVKKQAPMWMQRSGLEWLFRLIQEPKRLWRRYLIGNPLFVYYLIKNKFIR